MARNQIEETSSPTAPTSTIEAIALVRPLKVGSFLFLILCAFLLMVCLSCSTWLSSQGYRTGLFEECSNLDVVLPLPLNAPEPGTCQRIRSRGSIYIPVVLALLIIALLICIAGAVLTALGLKSVNPSKKYVFYKCALYISLIGVLLILVALVVFPVCFYMELKELGRPDWQFEWCYVVTWFAALFAFSATILLLCDKERDEIYYKERTIMHSNDATSPEDTQTLNTGR